MYGSHAGLLDRRTPDEFCSPAYASLVGALILGSDYRDAHPGQMLEQPKLNKIGQTIVELFTEQ